MYTRHPVIIMYINDLDSKHVMFGLFKKKSEVEKLQAEYAKLMATYHKLSTSNRAASDDAFAKANDIANQIDKLVKK